MSLSDLASIGSLVGGAAVLISLVYLALQVRQTERNQQASIRHSRVSRVVEISLAHADPGIAQARRRGMESPDEITHAELGQFLSLARAMFAHLEDSYYQHKEGLLNAEAYQMVVDGARTLTLSPGIRVAWKVMGPAHGGPFATFMDSAVARARLEPSARMPTVDEWQAAFAAETASGSR